MLFKIPRFFFYGRMFAAFVSFTVMVFVTLLVGCEERESSHRTISSTYDVPATSSLRPGFYDVRRVVDGDTLLLKDGKRIRLLGVDTPETVKPNTPPQPWGAEASTYTKNFCQTGTVWLEFDSEPTDKYGRYLAYVYDTNRSKMLNEQLLRYGLGKFLPYFPYSDEKKKLFSAAQSEAQREQLGIWSNSP